MVLMPDVKTSMMEIPSFVFLFFFCTFLNSPHGLEVEEGEGEHPDPRAGDAPHLCEVPSHLEVLPHHDAAGVSHRRRADSQQDAVAGGGEVNTF